MNEAAIEAGRWPIRDTVDVIVGDVQELTAQEIVIDTHAVIDALAQLRGFNVPTIPFLQIDISGANNTAYGNLLNARSRQDNLEDEVQNAAIRVAGMLLGGINNSSEEQGLYLASRISPDADKNLELTEGKLVELREEITEIHPTDEFQLGLFTPADYVLASEASRRIRDGLILDRFAVYSYYSNSGIGQPERPYTIFPQTSMNDGSALFGKTADDQDQPLSEFMRGNLSSETSSVGVRYSIAIPEIIGRGSIDIDNVSNLATHNGAKI